MLLGEDEASGASSARGSDLAGPFKQGARIVSLPININIEAMLALHDRRALEFEILATRSRPFHGFLQMSRGMFLEGLAQNPLNILECVTVSTVTGEYVLRFRVRRSFDDRIAIAAKDWFGVALV
jgi:hypothetical protein